MAATIVGCSGLAAVAQPVELIPLLPPWDSVFTLRAGGGYKDNVTLSHFAPESSPFVSAGLEGIVSRLFLDGSQFNFFLSGDERHYFSSPSVDDEQLVFAQAQGKKVLDENSEASAELEYVYQHQVVDVSATETLRQAVDAMGYSVAIRPGFRRNLDPNLWFSFELPVTRQFFKAPLDDYWDFAAKFTLGQDFGNKSTLTLSCQPSYVAYDEVTQVDASGSPIPNTHRAFVQPDLRATWRQHWDAAQHWRTTARVGCRINDDNGSGYFNFTQLFGYGEVRYRTKAWELSAGAKLSFYHYPVQTVSATDLSKRERRELYLDLRCERKLYKSLALVAAYGYEQVFSNDPIENYNVNTVSGSLQWEF